MKVRQHYFLEERLLSKFGPEQLREVDASDRALLGNGNKLTERSPVYTDVSPLCSSEDGQVKGNGVFAARDIPKDTPVTFYAGTLYTKKTKKDKEKGKDKKKDSEYVYVFADGVHKVDGAWQDPQNGPWWSLQGVGHMLNDNIHVHATGREANAYFAEVEMVDEDTCQRVQRVIIVTCKDVARGEELLVSYSLGYWLSKGDYHDLGPSCGQWLQNMDDLVQNFITRIYARGRMPTIPSTENEMYKRLSMLSFHPHDTRMDDTDHHETLPLLGEIECVDIYNDPEGAATFETYDFYSQTDVREGEFDLIFAFDNPHDMVCCDWQSPWFVNNDGDDDDEMDSEENAKDTEDTQDTEEDAVMDGDEDAFVFQTTCPQKPSKECRLTVRYVLDTMMNTWLNTHVTCRCCGRVMEFLSV